MNTKIQPLKQYMDNQGIKPYTIAELQERLGKQGAMVVWTMRQNF